MPQLTEALPALHEAARAAGTTLEVAAPLTLTLTLTTHPHPHPNPGPTQVVAPPPPADTAGLPAWLRPEHQRLNASLALAMVASLASRGAIRDEVDARRMPQRAPTPD